MPKTTPTYVSTLGLTQQIREVLKSEQWLSSKSLTLFVNVAPEAIARHKKQQLRYGGSGGGKGNIVARHLSYLFSRGQLDRRMQPNGIYEYKINAKGLDLMMKAQAKLNA